MAPVNFEKYIQKAHLFLNELAGSLNQELGIEENQVKASKAFRTVAHTIRDHIPHEESIQLIAQLPMFLKAVYVDSWSSGAHGKRVRHRGEFLDQVINYAHHQYLMEIQSREEAEKLVNIVLKVMEGYISSGELKDIQAILPTELKDLIPLKAGEH